MRSTDVPDAEPRRSLRLLSCALLCFVLVGCATPSPTYPDYRAKVSTTAKAMTGIISSAQLGARSWQRGQVLDTYADVVVSHAEQDAGSVQNTLDSRQPPNKGAIELKERIDPALQDATSALTDLRIALRRGDRAGVSKALDDLDQPMKRLQAIEQQTS